MYDEGLFDAGVKFMGPDGIFSPALIEQVGGAAVLEGNTYFTFPGLLPSLLTNEAGVRFYTDYLEAHGEEPDPYSVYAYAAAQAVLVAMETASETELNRANVLTALSELETYDGIITFGFDENGDNNNAAFIGYDFVDGNFANPVSITPTMHEDCGE
ncbi:MAG: ABC transporter substrate-binding protein [Chloroflexi bacterium]|nr:ABC transporter substrate-binding protein [Chloroflexota bacterium]